MRDLYHVDLLMQVNSEPETHERFLVRAETHMEAMRLLNNRIVKSTYSDDSIQMRLTIVPLDQLMDPKNPDALKIS